MKTFTLPWPDSFSSSMRRAGREDIKGGIQEALTKLCTAKAIEGKASHQLIMGHRPVIPESEGGEKKESDPCSLRLLAEGRKGKRAPLSAFSCSFGLYRLCLKCISEAHLELGIMMWERDLELIFALSS